MFTISDAQINGFLGLFIWPFARLTGLMMSDPIFSARTIPRHYKACFAFILTLIIAPHLPPFKAIPLASAQGLSLLFQQWLLGFAIGYVMRCLISAVELAGLLISTQMGLGFAMFFDPQNSNQTPAVSTLLSIFSTLLFLSFDGHHIVLATLIDSFTLLPIEASIPALTWKNMVLWASYIFIWGLWLALPIIATLLIVNLAIAIMTRAAPQFNIMTFGFPLTLTIGFMALYLSIPAIEPLIKKMFQSGFDFIFAMLSR